MNPKSIHSNNASWSSFFRMTTSSNWWCVVVVSKRHDCMTNLIKFSILYHIDNIFLPIGHDKSLFLSGFSIPSGENDLDYFFSPTLHTCTHVHNVLNLMIIRFYRREEDRSCVLKMPFDWCTSRSNYSLHESSTHSTHAIPIEIWIWKKDSQQARQRVCILSSFSYAISIWIVNVQWRMLSSSILLKWT